MKKKKVLIVSSGGLDSTSMALIKKEEGCKVDLISFNYGQKATKEIDRSRELSVFLKGDFKLIDISTLSFIFGKNNQLTNENVKVESSFKGSIVVPLRNSVFTNIAYIYAVTNQYDELILGSHLNDMEEDENGEFMFPDSSSDFYNALNIAYDIGKRKEDYKTKIVSAGMMGFGKTDLILKANKISEEMLFNSWSCYSNEESQCGNCDSCKNRKEAFKKANIEDKTKYK